MPDPDELPRAIWVELADTRQDAADLLPFWRGLLQRFALTGEYCVSVGPLSSRAVPGRAYSGTWGRHGWAVWLSRHDDGPLGEDRVNAAGLLALWVHSHNGGQ